VTDVLLNKQHELRSREA